MFTFIKKVIKTGTATSSYPLEPIAVDKTSVVSQSRTRSSASAARPASMPARQTL
ncbi:formate hydrogenlyase subunit 6 [Escherichia coli]|uniref:Formate hydrogenlyase subunit 6 n=1 Tax=Escherichia coli TaxID=562 RepID=A0A376TTD6_ECOLX|nr:formate hydrogenlyase subunit 6 [Escherichia coli]